MKAKLIPVSSTRRSIHAYKARLQADQIRETLRQAGGYRAENPALRAEGDSPPDTRNLASLGTEQPQQQWKQKMKRHIRTDVKTKRGFAERLVDPDPIEAGRLKAAEAQAEHQRQLAAQRRELRRNPKTGLAQKLLNGSTIKLSNFAKSLVERAGGER